MFNDCLPGKDAGLMGTPVDRSRVADDVPVFRKSVQAAVDLAAVEALSVSLQSAIASTITGVAKQFPNRIKALLLASDLIEGQIGDLIPDPRIPLSIHKRNEMLDKAVRLNLIPLLSRTTVEVYGVGYWDRQDKNAPRGGAPYRPLLDLTVREGLESFWTEYFRQTGSAPLRINR